MQRGKVTVLAGTIILTFSLKAGAFEINTNAAASNNAATPVVKQGKPQKTRQQEAVPAVMPAQEVNLMNSAKPKVEEIDAVQENRKSLITVNYSEYPVSVPVSREEVNVISVPYAIEKVNTSKENIKEIGKAEKEFSITVLKDRETDIVVKTTEKTFLLTLVPTSRHATHVVIDDAGAATKKAEETEKEFPHVELMTTLIKKALRGDQIEGYVALPRSEILNSPDATFIFKREIMGVKYKVVFIDIINRTSGVIQVRENMPFIRNIVSRFAGHPYATTVTREFIQPRNAEAERKGEFVSTIVAVVSSQQQ